MIHTEVPGLPATRLEVVLEPTGPSWLPIAVFFTRRGHTVYRVSSGPCAHDLRRVPSRQAKSNGIDADTLAGPFGASMAGVCSSPGRWRCIGPPSLASGWTGVAGRYGCQVVEARRGLLAVADQHA